MATTHNYSPPVTEATGDTNSDDTPAPQQTSHSTITLRQSIFPVSLVTVLFFLWGFAYGLLDVLNAKFQTALGITAAKAGGLQASYFGAYLIVRKPRSIFMPTIYASCFGQLTKMGDRHR